MKKLFKKTWFALLLCVVGVVASTLLNTRVKFGPLCEDVRASLYQTDANGTSLRFELEDYCSCQDTLIALASSQGVDTDSAVEARDALRALLNAEGVAAHTLYEGYAAVLAETQALTAALGEHPLGTHDSATLQRCLSSLESAQTAIEGFGYNAGLDEFLRKYDRLPTNALAAAVGIRYPERFS